MDNDHGGPPLGGDGAPPPLPANPEDGYTPYPVHYAHYHHAAHHQGTPQMQMQPQQHSWNYPPQPHVMYQFPPSHQQHTQHMHYHQQIPPPREDGSALDGKFPSTAQHQKLHQQHEIEIDKIDPVPVNVMQHHRQSETQQQQQQQEQQQNSQEPVREIQTTPATTAAAGVTNDETQLQPTKYDSFKEKETSAENDISSSIPTNEDEQTNQSSFPFNDILAQLQTYKERHNHVNIPKSDPAYTNILDSLIKHGIEHETNKKWNDKYHKLKEYKEKHGDCDFPEAHLEMGDWIKQQRKVHIEAAESCDYLFQHRFQQLDQIGFDWNTPPWDVRYQELATFKELNRHCDVPVNHPGGLGIWVINQRFNVRDMPKERTTVLDALGFIWNHNRKDRKDDAWNLQFEALMEYKRENGHCNVPTTRANATKLGKWVGKQREEYKKWEKKKQSQLSQYRIDKLNGAGFQWSLTRKSVSWEQRFEALKRFKEEHGHCVVPSGHDDFDSWPSYQRSEYKNWKEGKKSKLTKEKIDKLIEIGFLS